MVMVLTTKQDRRAVRLHFFRAGVARCPYDKALLTTQCIHQGPSTPPSLAATCPICRCDFSSDSELVEPLIGIRITTAMKESIHSNYRNRGIARCPFDDARLDIMAQKDSIRAAICPICGSDFT